MLFQFENVSFTYGGAPIVQNATFSLHENERVGLIGANGEGKTTLLNLLMGSLSPDEGTIQRKNGMTMGYLEQSGGFSSSSTVYGAMEEVFEEDRTLLARLEETQKALAHADEAEFIRLSARAESLVKRISARDSYHYDVKIKTVLNGMGFESVYAQKVDTMSGGEKTKLKLCRLLLEAPDLIVLDEPTNHLDVKTLFWLEEYLSAYKGAILVVSHDRYFLDQITERTLEIEGGTVCSYKGNYTKYRQAKAEKIAVMEREYEKQQEKLKQLQEYIDRNLVRATTAKSAQSRVKQRDKIIAQPVEAPKPPKKAPRFRFSFEETPYEKVLSAEHISLAFDGKPLLGDESLLLMRGKRYALLGDNGTGKSSLLKYLLSGRENVVFGRYVKTAYYDQENADLDPEEEVLSAFWGKFSLLTQTDARKKLAAAGLTEEDVHKKCKELSGGLKAKLELCILAEKHANFLVLDEPTNHLDLLARESLEEGLSSYEGTLLFVSHDRRFIERLADEIFYLKDGKIHSFAGNYARFLEWQKESEGKKPVSSSERTSAFAAKNAPAPAANSAADGQARTGYRSKEDRARDAKKKERVLYVERRLTQIEEREAALNEELARKAADYTEVRRITEELDALQRESETLYAEYETLIS